MNDLLTVTAHRLRGAPLWCHFLISLLGYVVLRLWFPFEPIYLDQPVRDFNNLAPEMGQALAYVALILLLYGVYALALARVKRRAPAAIWLWLAGAIYCLPLLTAFPINSTDLYRYAIRGRVASVYGANPYSTAPAAFPDDPYLPLAVEWADETSPYGPVWEALAGIITSAAPGDLWTPLLALKTLLALAHLGTAAVLWLGVRRGGDTVRAAGILTAWCWNPALLLIFVMDGHNDAVMLWWLVLGWTLATGRRPVVGFLVAVLGPLTKPIGLLALPFLFVIGWRQQTVLRDRWRFAILCGAGSLTIAWLVFLPYGSPVVLAERLLREAGNAASFSPATLAILLLSRLGVSVSLAQVNRLGTALFLLAAVVLFWRTWRGRRAERGVADIFYVYVWQALAFRIWYAAWPFAWLLLDETSPLRRRAGHLFLLTAQLSVIVYGHLWRIVLDRDHLLSHALGVPLAFLAPWLLAWLGSRQSPSAGTKVPAPPST